MTYSSTYNTSPNDSAKTSSAPCATDLWTKEIIHRLHRFTQIRYDKIRYDRINTIHNINNMIEEDFLYKEETYKIIGAMMEVHKTLGCGFLEAVYQEALALEFEARNIPYEREKKLNIYYKGVQLQKYYEADFYCYDKIVVELKALSALTSTHDAILINYLKATDSKIGLLANFGETSLKYKRLILDQHR